MGWKKMKEQNEKKIDSIFRSTVRFEIRRKKKTGILNNWSSYWVLNMKKVT